MGRDTLNCPQPPPLWGTVPLEAVGPTRGGQEPSPALSGGILISPFGLLGYLGAHREEGRG